MNELVDGYRRFSAKDDEGLYSGLVAGQSPHTLLFSCSDSRIVPELIFDAKPGEIFMVRNVGNLARTEEQSVAAAIDYAVGHLKVKRVAVLAHEECGAVKACKSKEGIHEASLLDWLCNESFDGMSVTEAIKSAGIRQLNRLKDYPTIKKAIATGDVVVELYYFGLTERSLEIYLDESWKSVK